MTVGCYCQWPPTAADVQSSNPQTPPACRLFARACLCTLHENRLIQMGMLFVSQNETYSMFSLPVGMCDVTLIAVGISRPPKPAAPVSFNWFGQRSQHESWMLSSDSKWKGSALSSRAVECIVQQLLHIYISDSLSLNPAWWNLPQIVSPHPCSTNPPEFMTLTLTELHKHGARPFSPEVPFLRLAVAGSSCTTQLGPELFSSVGLSVPPTRGHSVPPEFTLCKILHQ